uniref:3-5 exoribonuclease CSL4 n=1 Tax=Arundo donax TaxID=35708 RepID=A0A0A9GI60_ARUDO
MRMSGLRLLGWSAQDREPPRRLTEGPAVTVSSGEVLTAYHCLAEREHAAPPVATVGSEGEGDGELVASPGLMGLTRRHDIREACGGREVGRRAAVRRCAAWCGTLWGNCAAASRRGAVGVVSGEPLPDPAKTAVLFLVLVALSTSPRGGLLRDAVGWPAGRDELLRRGRRVGRSGARVPEWRGGATVDGVCWAPSQGGRTRWRRWLPRRRRRLPCRRRGSSSPGARGLMRHRRMRGDLMEGRRRR